MEQSFFNSYRSYLAHALTLPLYSFSFPDGESLEYPAIFTSWRVSSTVFSMFMSPKTNCWPFSPFFIIQRTSPASPSFYVLFLSIHSPSFFFNVLECIRRSPALIVLPVPFILFPPRFPSIPSLKSIPSFRTSTNSTFKIKNPLQSGLPFYCPSVLIIDHYWWVHFLPSLRDSLHKDQKRN